MRRRLGLMLLCAAFLSSGNAEAESKELPLPKLPSGSVELRVVHAINPRLSHMSAEQLQVLLSAVKTTAQQYFGVTLRFPPVDEIPLVALVQQLPADRWRERRKSIYDFKEGRGDPRRLATSFAGLLKQSGESLPAMTAYVKQHMRELEENSYEALGAALAELQLKRIERWKRIKALDGGSVIDAAPYNELEMWLALGYGDVPYELVLTNQPIVSVEYGSVGVHTAIRGGYTNGLTTYSKRARFGTYSVWSTFAFTNNDEWIKQLRGGETYRPHEAARLAGIHATHELGHQLFHLLHPYGRSACIMSPVQMLAFRAGAEKFSPKDCPLGSNPAMRPGAYKFRYEPR